MPKSPRPSEKSPAPPASYVLNPLVTPPLHPLELRHSPPQGRERSNRGQSVGNYARRAWNWLCAPSDTYVPWKTHAATMGLGVGEKSPPSFAALSAPAPALVPRLGPTLVLDGPSVDALVARAPTAVERSVLLQRLTDEQGPDAEMTPEGENRLLDALDGREDCHVLGLFLRQRKADPLTAYLAHYPAPPQRTWPAVAFDPLADEVKTDVLRQARLVDGTLVQLHYPAFNLREVGDAQACPGPEAAVPGCPPTPLAIRVVPPAPDPASVARVRPTAPRPIPLPADARMPLLSLPEEVPQGVVFRTVWASFLFCAQRRDADHYREPINAGRLDLAYGWYKAHQQSAVPMEPVPVGRRLPALYPHF